MRGSIIENMGCVPLVGGDAFSGVRVVVIAEDCEDFYGVLENLLLWSSWKL